MVLLVCSGLFLRSLYSAGNIDTGFAHRNLLLMAFDPSLNRYAPAETRRLVDRILEAARAMPGVEVGESGRQRPAQYRRYAELVYPGGTHRRWREGSDSRRHLLRRAAVL